MKNLQPTDLFNLRRPLARAALPAALLLLASPAGALLNIDGTRNQVFVFGGVSYGYNSNIFAQPDGSGDYTLSARAGVELKRRAGIIAVNLTAQADHVSYGTYTDEDSLNPNVSLELSKSSGRTTGSFTVNAYRETRSDAAVNLRTTTWNLPVALNLRYPVNDKLYVTSATGYLSRSYDDNSGLVDYTDYSQAFDAFYVYTSKLDLLGGYRLRHATTSIGGRTTDHWFNLGATGGLFSKLSGTVRAGYQFRHVQGTAGEDFDQFNAMASLSWPLTRKLSLGSSVSRDFNTIATGASVDSSSAALRATYSFSRKLEFSADTAGGRNRFLGRNQPARTDTFLTWGLAARYTASEHFQLGASYTYFRNWSTFSFSDYDSHGFSLDVSSRY